MVLPRRKLEPLRASMDMPAVLTAGQGGKGEKTQHVQNHKPFWLMPHISQDLAYLCLTDCSYILALVADALHCFTH